AGELAADPGGDRGGSRDDAGDRVCDRGVCAEHGGGGELRQYDHVPDDVPVGGVLPAGGDAGVAAAGDQPDAVEVRGGGAAPADAVRERDRGDLDGSAGAGGDLRGVHGVRGAVL